MPVIEQSAGFLHLDEDAPHIGTIVDVQSDTGQFGPQLKFIIEIDGDGLTDDGLPRQTWAFTTQNYSARSKLGQYAQAVLGEMPEALDTDDFIGREVEVTFEQYNKVDPISGQNMTKEKVVGLRAA